MAQGRHFSWSGQTFDHLPVICWDQWGRKKSKLLQTRKKKKSDYSGGLTLKILVFVLFGWFVGFCGFCWGRRRGEVRRNGGCFVLFGGVVFLSGGLCFVFCATPEFKLQLFTEESELTTNINRKECWNVEFKVAKAETPQGFVSQARRSNSCSNWMSVEFSAHFIICCTCNPYVPTVSPH